MDITFCMLAKNEAHCIRNTLMLVKPHVSNILVVDDHSTDNTKEIARMFTPNVVDLPFSIKDRGFSEALNWEISQVETEWILWLDADEILTDIDKLHTLTRYPDKDIWALPRRKWLNYSLQQRIEYERYPDWQVRLFKKKEGIFYEGEAHPHFIRRPIFYAYQGPTIEHLQIECQTPNKLAFRQALYEDLGRKQGVAPYGGDLLPVESFARGTEKNE